MTAGLQSLRDDRVHAARVQPTRFLNGRRRGEDARHTALTNLFSGGLARGIVNRAMRELGPIHPLAPPFPLAAAAIAPLRAAAEKAGSGDFSPLWSGQNPAGCRAVPAAEITRALAAGW